MGQIATNSDQMRSRRLGAVGSASERLGLGRTEEDELWHRLDDYFAACTNGDLDEIMSFFSYDIVAYDMPPQLRFKGREAYRKSWHRFFVSQFKFPVEFEFREQNLQVSGDLGVVHCLTHMTGTFKKSGEETSCWLRHTILFQRLRDQWMITHEHVSVPIGEDGRALMHLNPDSEPLYS